MSKAKPLQPDPGSSVLLYPVMLTCSHCDTHICFRRGEELPFGDINCERHKKSSGRRNIPTQTHLTKASSSTGSVTSAKRIQRESNAIIVAPSKKKSKATSVESKRPGPAKSSRKPPALSTSSPSPRRTSSVPDISSGLLTPPLTPLPRVFALGAAVMVRVGKTDWSATVVAASKTGRQYQVRFDGLHKGHETWHDVDRLQGMEEVGRRPRATAMAHVR
jgi:hypothetical protein